MGVGNPLLISKERCCCIVKFFRYPLTFFLCLCPVLTFAAPRYHPEAARLYDAGLRALARGDQEKARTTLEKAITLDASIADAHCVLGLIYKGAEETRAAAAAFRQATLADETYIEAYYELADVLLIHLGDTAQATHLLQKIRAMDPDHARTRTLLGIAYFRDNLIADAVRELRHALKLDPTSLIARYTLGNAFLQQEKWHTAIETFNTLLESDPFHAKAHFSLGTAYRRIGETAAAQQNLKRFEVLSIEEEQLTHLKRFVQQHPTDAEAWYRLGRIQLKRQLWEEATQSLERYIALAPQETRGYEALGYVHFQGQHYRQAVTMYQKAVQQKPKVATYRNSLAGAYLMLKQYPEAIDQYQTAIQLKPSEPRFYLNLSKAYELAGAHTEAEKTYQEYERLTSKPTAP